MKQIVGILITIVVCGALAAAIVFDRPVAVEESTAVSVVVNGGRIRVDVAATPVARARGLGGRENLAPGEGMLFVFDAPGRYGFWMKDMRFSIDLIWIADGRVVGVTENIDPQVGAPDTELRVYAPPEPVSSVLEIAAGQARERGISRDDMVRIEPAGSE